MRERNYSSFNVKREQLKLCGLCKLMKFGVTYRPDPASGAGWLVRSCSDCYGLRVATVERKRSKGTGA